MRSFVSSQNIFQWSYEGGFEEQAVLQQWRNSEMYTGLWCGNLKVRQPLGKPRCRWEDKIKIFLRGRGEDSRIGANGGLSWKRKWTLDFWKMRWISRLAETTLAFQKGLYPMESVRERDVAYINVNFCVSERYWVRISNEIMLKVQMPYYLVWDLKFWYWYRWVLNSYTIRRFILSERSLLYWFLISKVSKLSC